MQPPNNYPNNVPNPYPQPQWNPYQPPPKPRGNWRGRLIVLAIALVIYVIACATPALEFNDPDDEVWYGLRVLVLGWQGAFIGQFAWFANLFLLISAVLLLFRRWLTTLVVSLLTFALALQTFVLFSQKVPANEGGTRYIELQHLKVGFYFWLASILTLGISALVLRHHERKQLTKQGNI